MFHLFGAPAEFECSLILIRERTNWLIAARMRCMGRPQRLDSIKRALVLKLHNERNHTIEEICQMMGISKSMLYNYPDKANSDVIGMA